MSEYRREDRRGIACPQTISIGQAEAELGLSDPADCSRRSNRSDSVLQQTGIAESAHWDRRAPARPEPLMSEYRREDRRGIACPQTTLADYL